MARQTGWPGGGLAALWDGRRTGGSGATWLANHTALWGMLSLGFAGALHTHLATGDAFLATHIMALSTTPEGPGYCAADVVTPAPDLYKVATAAAAASGPERQAGRLLSVPTVISQSGCQSSAWG